MKFDVKIKYNEEYLPTKRHRIPRLREVEEIVPVEIREIRRSDTRPALVVTDYQSYVDRAGINQFGPLDTEYLAFGDMLCTQKPDREGALIKGTYDPKNLISDLEWAARSVWSAEPKDLTRDRVLNELQSFADKHLIIDGEVYCRTAEPRYEIVTFGLGHNHGGTGLFITNHYNPNISRECYFNALQREEAIAHARDVAARRGDTESIDRLGENINIKVLMPEIIRCDPQTEHGEGSPLLNSFEAIIEGSQSSFEAGLSVIATAVAGNSPKNLDGLIQSAETRADGRTVIDHVSTKQVER